MGDIQTAVFMYLSVVYLNMKFVYPFRFFSIQICFSLMYTNLVLLEYPSDVSASCLLCRAALRDLFLSEVP